MQTNIIDYLNSLSVLQKDKEQAELGIRERDVQIGRISEEAYRDALTGVGSKAAYVRKMEELNADITAGTAEFAIVMYSVAAKLFCFVLKIKKNPLFSACCSGDFCRECPFRAYHENESAAFFPPPPTPSPRRGLFAGRCAPCTRYSA